MGVRISDRDLPRRDLCVCRPGSGGCGARQIDLLFVPRIISAGAHRRSAAQIALEHRRVMQP